jgi:hypothetical protein
MKKIVAALFAVAVFQFVHAQEDTTWQKLEPFFSVPRQYADSFGSFRSPLKFYNGQMVKSRADWRRRRKEILARWQDMLGQWPPLIENPVAEVIDSVHQENFTRYHIRFNWRADEKTSAYILVPDAPGIKPAVIADFYEPETAVGLNKPYGQFALYLVRRGFIAMSIGVDAYYKGVPPNAQFYPNGDSAVVQPLYMLAYLAANSWNLLSHWKDVDKKRIGIVGHSYGSKWAMFASCLYEKFACAVWCDGGIVFDEARPNVNYWDPWYLGYYPPPWNAGTNAAKSKGIYPYLVRNGYDLTELHALMAPRPFMVSGGSEDGPQRWRALNHAVAINRLLGYEHRVGMTNRKEHRPDEESMEQICLFFEYFLKSSHH